MIDKNLKLLLLHTSYKVIGGEDIAYLNEKKYLEEFYDVQEVKFSNSDTLTTSEQISFITNSNAASNSKLEKKINDFKPNVLYVHNTWFKSSLGIFDIAKKYNLKIILKLHNFRYDCINALHFRNNESCHDCSTSNRAPGILNKCYENSFLKSIGLTNYSKKYFKVLNENVDSILVLTNFHKEYLVEIGVDSKKIFVHPNYLEHKIIEENFKEKYFVYGGRLSSEKGVDYLIDEWKALNLEKYKLKIIGEGPLKKDLNNEKNIEIIDSVSNNEIIKIINNSVAVVNPTRLYEGQPTLLCEASMQKKVSIFPNNGGINEFFPQNYPFIFEDHNTGSLSSKIKMVIDKPLLVEKYEDLNYQYLKNKLDKKILIKNFSQIL